MASALPAPAEPDGARGGVPYAFAASHADLIDAQLACIQDCYDPATVARLLEIGVRPGWRCWEIGVGAGSIASWLADRVGPTGHVLATDMSLDRAPHRPGVALRHHDLLRDEVPGERFDLIHARLVLQHLPERYRVLGEIITALRPGGWLLLEDFDCTYLPALTGDGPYAALYGRVLGVMLRTLSAAGIDIAWGARTFRASRAAGLVDVASTSYAVASPGGTPGARLFAVNARQMHDRLVAAGLAQTDLDMFQLLLADPTFAVNSYTMTSTRGRRPAEGA